MVLYMTLSHNERYLGVAVGVMLIKDFSEVKTICIYAKNSKGFYDFVCEKEFTFKEACPKFHFNRKNDSELMFVTENELFAFNFKKCSKHGERNRRCIYQITNQFDK